MGGCFSFPLGFHFAFSFLPPPVRGGGGAGRRREARLQPGEGKPSQKPVFKVTSASSRLLNAGSHFGARPIAEGDMPTPKKILPPPCPKTQSKKKSKSWEGVSSAGGAGRPRCCREPSQLLAITRRRGQSRHRSQIISCFNAGRVFWTAFFQLSLGKNVSPCAYQRCRCCRQSKAQVEVWESRSLVSQMRNTLFSKQGRSGGHGKAGRVLQCSPRLLFVWGLPGKGQLLHPQCCANQDHQHKFPPQRMYNYSTPHFPPFFSGINAGRFPQIQPNSCHRPPCHGAATWTTKSTL